MIECKEKQCINNDGEGRCELEYIHLRPTGDKVGELICEDMVAS